MNEPVVIIKIISNVWFKPVFTSSSAILNTLQQVAGAIGTALFISVMSSSTENYMETEVTNPAEPAQLLEGALHGYETTFTHHYPCLSHFFIKTKMKDQA